MLRTERVSEIRESGLAVYENSVVLHNVTHPMENEKLFLTIKEASEVLGVSKDTLRRWERIGKLKTKRHPMNNYRIYEPSEVNALKRSILGG